MNKDFGLLHFVALLFFICFISLGCFYLFVNNGVGVDLGSFVHSNVRNVDEYNLEAIRVAMEEIKIDASFDSYLNNRLNSGAIINNSYTCTWDKAVSNEDIEFKSNDLDGATKVTDFAKSKLIDGLPEPKDNTQYTIEIVVYDNNGTPEINVEAR